MTIQITDSLMMENEKYAIICDSVPHAPFFNAASLGLKPEYISTNAGRGFWCDFYIKERTLYLDNLNIHTEGDIYPPLNGVHATPPVEREIKTTDGRAHTFKSNCGHHVYKGVGIPIQVSAKLLIAKDRYAHPAPLVKHGFPTYWKYGCIKSIEICEGKVKAITDETATAIFILNKIITLSKDMDLNRIDDLDLHILTDKAEESIEYPSWFMYKKKWRRP